MKLKIFRYNEPAQIVEISYLRSVDARSGNLLAIDCVDANGEILEIVCYSFDVL